MKNLGFKLRPDHHNEDNMLILPKIQSWVKENEIQPCFSISSFAPLRLCVR